MSRTSRLAVRMKYLRTTEGLFAVALFPFLCGYWLNAGGEIAWRIRTPSLALVCYLLAQGSLYWALKYRQFAHAIPLPSWLPALFRLFRLSNIAGMLAVAAWLGLAASRGTAPADLGWGAGLLVFACLEHINYYHLQLMYDTRGALRRLTQTRRLRTPMLSSDMRARSGAARASEPLA